MKRSAQAALLAVIVLGTACGWTQEARASLVLEAEVLEGSGSLDVIGAQSGVVRYALIHHAREQDQPAFSQWLRSHESARVIFSVNEGQPHHGVLSRLKHCFGRGMLIYADPVGLHDKDLVRLELPP